VTVYTVTGRILTAPTGVGAIVEAGVVAHGTSIAVSGSIAAVNNTVVLMSGNGNSSNRITNINKNESEQWRQLNPVRNTELRTSGQGSKKQSYAWDYTHNDIEVYNSRGVHLGAMDPVSGEMYKPAVPGRTIVVR